MGGRQWVESHLSSVEVGAWHLGQVIDAPRNDVFWVDSLCSLGGGCIKECISGHKVGVVR